MNDSGPAYGAGTAEGVHDETYGRGGQQGKRGRCADARTRTCGLRGTCGGEGSGGGAGGGVLGRGVILAVPYGAVEATVGELGDAINGKVVVDASNALTPDYQLAVGVTTSAAEELQKQVPGAKVVKAFNTVFAQHLDTGTVKGTQLSLFVAGDNDEAKASVGTLGRDLGFDAVDAGPLANARWLETLG